MSKSNRRILFVYRRLVPFVKGDLEMLRKHFVVYPVRVSMNVLKVIKGLVSFVPRADIVFVWFAGFQAFLSVFLAKLFRKKLVVVAGGYDAVYAPEIGYGVFTCWWRAAMAFFVYKNADFVLAVSENTKKELFQRVKTKKVVTIHNGVDIRKFTPIGRKEKFVLTVGAVNNSNLKKKGFETFVRTAKFLPRTRFILVGSHVHETVQYLRKIASENVEFTGFISFKKLLNFYRRAMVYTQLSYHESFGVALAEAMACECIPVVTRRAALPEVAGNCGIYVPYGDAEATAEAIKKAFGQEKLGKCARGRIVRMLSFEKREKELVEIIDSL